MSETFELSIGNETKSLVIKEYNGQRVVTFKDIDEQHQRPNGTAGRNFRENRKHFLLNVDFFELNQPDEIRRLGFFQRPQGGFPKTLILLTESGYSMLVKPFTDDLSWAVQRQLVNGYFRAKKMEELAINIIDPQIFEQAIMQSNQINQLCLKTIEQNTQVLAAMNQKIDNLIETVIQNNSPSNSELPSKSGYTFCQQIPAQRTSKIGLSKMNSLEMPLKLEVIKRRFLKHDTFVELARFLSDREISISRSSIHKYFNQVLQELQLEDENNLEIIEREGPVTRHIVVKNGQISVQVTQIG
ncbi:MAG: ORF6N domain-containing protein [Bacteroidota bacterium]